ncbi:mas-related G-protein coupled receptor member A1-like [Heliangelus exortis]|uniref:mas-related G-protein coupled receptor member A1-like n=1 Tax=Heliangelus exortis TaxID=472823 RepID=UPI003A9436E4
METAVPACWSQLGGTACDRTWPPGLLRHEDNDYQGIDCEAGHWSKATITLLICPWGLVGNGAVLWFLTSCFHRNPITIYVLNLALANFTFLLSVTLALLIFHSPGSLCHRLGSRDVTTLLNITVLFSFTASVYLLAAFSTVTSLSILPPAHHVCHGSWILPVLICALLWLLSFLLTIILYFCPTLLVVFLLSYLLSMLTLVFSALTLLARILCWSWQYPPRRLCLVVLLVVFFFPFFTADFGYWLLLRLLDFSVFVLDASVPFACLNSTISPVIYFLAGSFKKKFTLSLGLAFQRAFEGVTEPPSRGGTPRENVVEISL